MHLPQGMTIGLLASLRPIYGLYSTFLPVLFYVIFGTSPYISFGTNAVMALLTQTVVERKADAFIAGYPIVGNSSTNQTSRGPSDAEILHVKVGTAMACSFLLGVLLVIMGILKVQQPFISLRVKFQKHSESKRHRSVVLESWSCSTSISFAKLVQLK